MKLNKNEREMLALLGKHPDKWHSFTQDAPTIKTVKSLVDKGLIEATIFDTMRIIPIDVKIGVAGYEQLYTMNFVGIGAYPYDCIAKDKYPNDPIYADEFGAWVSLRDFDYDGKCYHLPYHLK